MMSPLPTNRIGIEFGVFYGIKQAQDDYQRLMNNKSPKKQRKKAKMNRGMKIYSSFSYYQVINQKELAAGCKVTANPIAAAILYKVDTVGTGKMNTFGAIFQVDVE